LLGISLRRNDLLIVKSEQPGIRWGAIPNTDAAIGEMTWKEVY